MELIEREIFLTSLQTQFDKIKQGEGHIELICGEAGMGKTSLVKSFCAQQKDKCPIYVGTCDALFAPRPLAPLYDVALQMGDPALENGQTIDDRAGLFTHFFQALGTANQPVILVFEDIHWADEATLDFIKFFARRISLELVGELIRTGSRVNFVSTKKQSNDQAVATTDRLPVGSNFAFF